MTENSYLPQMTSDPKNKGTLFSSTLKVEEVKVHSFSWSEIILVSYGNFDASWTYQKTPNQSQTTISSHLPQITSNPKNKGTLSSSSVKVEDKKVPLFF